MPTPYLRKKHKNVQGDYTQIPNFIMREPYLNTTAKCLYSILKSFDYGKGSIFPSQETLGKFLDIEPRAVRNHKKDLEECGLVTTIRRGVKQSNLYITTDEFNPEWREKNPLPKPDKPKKILIQESDRQNIADEEHINTSKEKLAKKYKKEKERKIEDSYIEQKNQENQEISSNNTKDTNENRTLSFSPSSDSSFSNFENNDKKCIPLSSSSNLEIYATNTENNNDNKNKPKYNRA